jgi:hypothetical protein
MSTFHRSSNNSNSSFKSFKDGNNINNVFRKNNEKTITFKQQQNDFPELYTTTSSLTTNSSLCFKEAINKVTDNINNEDIILPGTVKIYFKQGKIVYQYGEILEPKNENINDDPNKIMDKIITNIKLNRDRYIKHYNKLHGNNAYEDQYVLPSIYGPEYDNFDDLDDYNYEGNVYMNDNEYKNNDKL